MIISNFINNKMTGFHIQLDNKFDELISNLKEKKEITINDLIKLKSFINKIYDNFIKSKKIEKNFKSIFNKFL